MVAFFPDRKYKGRWMRKIHISEVFLSIVAFSLLYKFLQSSFLPGDMPQDAHLQSLSSYAVQRLAYDLIIMVPSIESWRDRRDRIRRQFSRNQKMISAKVLLLFVVSDEDFVTVNTESENRQHHDMVYVDCKDSDLSAMPEENSSTTCKVLRGVQHVTKNFEFSFLARIGDDAYFRFDYFWNAIQPTLSSGPLYMGRFLKEEKVWEPHLQEHLWLKTYPPYASGMGYIFSKETAQYIGEASRLIAFRTGYPEDAVVALWLLGTQTVRLHSERFHNHPGGGPYNVNECTNDSIVVHYMTPALWESIDDQGMLLC